MRVWRMEDWELDVPRPEEGRMWEGRVVGRGPKDMLVDISLQLLVRVQLHQYKEI